MIGESIGNFKIASRLGRGGMGEVYVGEHETIQTRVAIKLLHPEISLNAEHVQRFHNEAVIVGRIKHAGIVKIFDTGMYKAHAYLIMELLEGEALSARIARVGRVAWRDTVAIGRQIASVLEATHRAGVIHRDLKPENIFLIADHELAGGERVKVLDFGISKLSGTIASGAPKTVGTMGTPAYMAPEQWGDSASVDWRADAYSLGCVLFEMACGRPPFDARTIAEACAKHLHDAPPAPRGLVELPAALEALILRLLAKRPEDRGESMAQVTRELDVLASAMPSLVGGSDIEHAMAAVAAASSPRVALATTIGSSAAELRVAAPARKLPRAAIGAGVAVAVAIVVAVALAGGGGGSEPAAPRATATPALPPPPPPPQPEPPRASEPVVPPPVPVAEPVPAPVTPPKPRPTRPKPPPAAARGSGSAAVVPEPTKPPDNGFGGRI
jgi:eukaryotic-like serine/threonine-protein kinase